MKETTKINHDHQLLTVLITTSPVPSHPDTSLIESVLNSFNHIRFFFEKHPSTRVVILCDGYKISSSKNDLQGCKFKRGIIDEATERNYLEYIRRLHQLCRSYTWFELEVHCMKSHSGFGNMIRYAVQEVVDTQYVMVVQHDYVLMQSFPIFRLLSILREFPEDVQYIKLNSLSTKNYIKMIHGKYNVSLESRIFSKLRLIPLTFYYDKTHLANVDFYRKVVFNESISEGKWKIKPGFFIEDTFGQFQLNDIKHNSMVRHEFYKTYLFVSQVLVEDSDSLSSPEETDIVFVENKIIAHLDGRCFKTENERLLLRNTRLSEFMDKSNISENLLEQRIIFSLTLTTSNARLDVLGKLLFQLALTIEQYCHTLTNSDVFHLILESCHLGQLSIVYPGHFFEDHSFDGNVDMEKNMGVYLKMKNRIQLTRILVSQPDAEEADRSTSISFKLIWDNFPCEAEVTEVEFLRLERKDFFEKHSMANIQSFLDTFLSLYTTESGTLSFLIDHILLQVRNSKRHDWRVSNRFYIESNQLSSLQYSCTKKSYDVHNPSK